MKSHGPVFSTVSALALAAGMALTGAPVFAQQAGSGQQSNAVPEHVTVVAPRIVRTRVRGVAQAPDSFGYYDLLTLTHKVNYADLNLARPEDAKTLENRIDETASQICRQLANAPPAEPRSTECVHKAIQSAMDQAYAAIAAAKGAKARS